MAIYCMDTKKASSFPQNVPGMFLFCQLIGEYRAGRLENIQLRRKRTALPDKRNFVETLSRHIHRKQTVFLFRVDVQLDIRFAACGKERRARSVSYAS